ncbi:uncharacterized protein N0V89_001560 [Didymosphaeria variabile]|uniref:BTB domain-containing protein n=1 Tax=Didymosphaeria variabile TaxID=1932322 RepID=A0A9W8XXA8_9PLEO|nr:uncharacterized protein N0V89_001560 [Didymosphaeria variabile]KAJ4360991.1 hypothetical protein N0V89_001560 [Didymosphaeria variabile]
MSTFSKTQTVAMNPLAADHNPLVSAKTPVHEVMNGCVDLRQLSHEERRGLLEGPMVTLTLNGNFIARVHKRVLMAVSLWANNRIQDRATTTVLALPASASRADRKALKTVIGWMSMAYVGAVKLRGIPMGQNTVEACKIFHAATALDMRPHVSHIAAYFHTYINDQNTLLGYEELDAILRSFAPDTPVFKHLAKDLAHRHHKGKVPDMKEFTAYLKKNPDLSRAMIEVDKGYAAARKEKREAAQAAARVKYSEARKEERRLMTEQRRREDFEANLSAARGGRSGGYGMGI